MPEMDEAASETISMIYVVLFDCDCYFQNFPQVTSDVQLDIEISHEQDFISSSENYLFLFVNQNVCYGYSKEPSQ